MGYPVQVYVDADGDTYTATRTDQHHSRATERTVDGRPVAYAGRWFPSQMSYRPYWRAVRAATERAKMVAGLAAN